MMRHLLLFVLVIYVVVISNAWAQNRGSVRYVPPENYDGGDSTRAPRPASSRGAAVNRRQRTTKAPETSATVVDEQPKASYQPAETPSRTTGRRVPQRSNTRQVAPPPPPTPVIEPAALYPAPGAELSEIPTTGTEGKPQGTRRRRPKKRRKPQPVVPKTEDVDKPSEISELINDDRKRTEVLSSTSQLRHSTHNSDAHQSSHPQVIDIPVHQPQQNSAGPQYFRPQPATNRLPVDDSDTRGNSGYLDPSIVNPNADVSNEYIRKEHSASVRNEGNYVPVLSPGRLPSDGTSRLTPQNYPVTRNREYVGETLPSDKYVPFGLQGGNSYTGQGPNTISGVQPTSNIIPQPDELTAPIHGDSENRLPSAEHSFLSTEHETSKGNEAHLKAENRFLNPSEAHDSSYPEYSSAPQRVVGRRQESGGSNMRRNTLPNSLSRRDESENDAQFDRRQTSQYRPPLQRTHSRYKPEEASEVTKARVTLENSVPTSPPRSRGSTRYQSERRRITEEPVKDNTPPRTRSSSTSRSSSTRGRQPIAVTESTSTPRPSSRRQPVTASPPRKVEYTPEPTLYNPVEEDTNNDHIIPSNRREIQHQSLASARAEADEEQEYGSIRNTLRSRPQYEVRDTEPYEESVENANTYDNEFQLPRKPPARAISHQRSPAVRQQLPPPEYQLPTYRQQNRPEVQPEAPQPEYQQPTYRQLRPEPQYEAPQNSRSRQLPQYQQPQNPRQNAPVPRQQVRPRQQEPEAPTAARSRHTATTKFVCPEAYGYYADPVQCDKYYECRNGTAELNLCNDGLAFNEISAPKFLRCDSLRDVDCKSRPELQEPKPTKNCPRQFGLYAHETDCTKFWNCVDGTATEVQCPPGLIYNDNLGTCDWADLVENSCKSEDLLGFTCPEATAYDLQDGVYSSYPHPDNCQLHYICIKGADGLRRPRLLTCNEGQVFNPTTASCTRPEDVAGCEDFYGPRSPPKRRPAPREPEPEEELIEEPTPKPRRRVNTNRRTRN